MKEKLRILVVDDDRHMTLTLVDILSVVGYEVVEASSGEEALEKAKTISFDCVLTDIRMQGMNGIELHHALRQIQPGLPLVLMTAYATEDLLQEGQESGVVGALNKPLDIKLLLDLLAALNQPRIVAIVDDDPDFCLTLGDILQQRGFSVLKIIDPHTEITRQVEGAQVILLDMKFNGITGLDVLREIRCHDPDVPVLLITGHCQEMAAVIKKTVELNIYACLLKPLEVLDLLQKLGEIQIKNLSRMIPIR
jgi:CheY-like chemotaxis protein